MICIFIANLSILFYMFIVRPNINREEGQLTKCNSVVCDDLSLIVEKMMDAE